tara:strand:- start:3126 stop:4319 length:1194 start_codon:yes stop_codon:yes gene_type:complete
MKILILSPYLPSENSGHAGAQLIFRNIISLSRKYNITLVCFVNDCEENEIDKLEKLGICVHPILYLRNQKTFKNKIYSFIQNLEAIFNFLKLKEPFFFAKYKKVKMQSLIKKLLNNNNYDIVQFEYNIMYHYTNAVKDIPKVINFHDISTKVYQRASKHGKLINRLYYKMTKRLEPIIGNRFDYVITLSNEDKKYLSKLGCKSRIKIIPPQINIPSITNGYKKINEICFLGSFNREPNIQAVRILIEKIIPQLSSNIKLNIVGKGLPYKISSKIAKNNSISYLGFVDDIDNFLSTQMMMVSPILIGSGIKMKNLHSLACSTAVLTTKVGAEGININSENGLWVSDISSMAPKINSLLKDEDLLIDKGRRGREIVKEKFSRFKIVSQYESIYSNLMKQ